MSNIRSIKWDEVTPVPGKHWLKKDHLTAKSTKQVLRRSAIDAVNWKVFNTSRKQITMTHLSYPHRHSGNFKAPKCGFTIHAVRLLPMFNWLAKSLLVCTCDQQDGQVPSHGWGCPYVWDLKMYIKILWLLIFFLHPWLVKRYFPTLKTKRSESPNTEFLSMRFRSQWKSLTWNVSRWTPLSRLYPLHRLFREALDNPRHLEISRSTSLKAHGVETWKIMKHGK